MLNFRALAWRFSRLCMLHSHFRKSMIVLVLSLFVLGGIWLVKASPGQDTAVFSTADQPRVVSQAQGFTARLVQLFGLDMHTWKYAFSATIPMLENDEIKETIAELQENNTLLDAMVMLVTDINPKQPRTFLTSGIPLLARVEYEPPQNSSQPGTNNLPPLPPPVEFLPGQALVAIYHTHSTECFVPTYGSTHSKNGPGDIVDVGTELAKALAAKGIKAVQSKVTNDLPKMRLAYEKSEITARQLIKENPGLQLIIDLHRDAEERENTTAKISGEEVAKIMVVVTNGQAGYEHPNWQQNYAFAQLLVNKMDKMYPGLSRGISISEYRYNEHLSPRLLVVEVGGHENKKEEAIRSMKLFANVIAELLKDLQAQNS